ncbi:hypothetical protein [Nonomuraea zeae]|uniref:Uncharacterized protein n=1 Tax=Nonomuraea zeae TaxID=1642303 RepID=A0A5S4GKY2_9ACTN|nr:hypothetical protein [Nonomuraea zeae]TMR33543.1 hypothetical protein ETD85_19470 [Nonomuraea zeae]
MPTLEHELLLELVQHRPSLVATLLAETGVTVPAFKEARSPGELRCQLLGRKRKRPSLQLLAVDGLDGPVRVRQRDSLPSP